MQKIKDLTSSDDHNVMESEDDYLQGIGPLLESSAIAENDVLVKSVTVILPNCLHKQCIYIYRSLIFLMLRSSSDNMCE